MNERTVEDDNVWSGTELLLNLGKSLGDRIGVRDVDRNGNQTLLLERFPRPDGDFIPLLLQLVRNGETDVTSRADDESSWRHCSTGRNVVCECVLWMGCWVEKRMNAVVGEGIRPLSSTVFLYLVPHRSSSARR